VKTDIEAGETVRSVKNNAKTKGADQEIGPSGSANDEANYSFKMVSSSKRKMNIYKAQLERIVDGDTIRVILDLGFEVFHREILRLKGINAPERKTNEGKRSKEVLEDILGYVPFLIIKTISIDVFGRYVADVFFDEGKNEHINPQIIAESGKYLNQTLLDLGVVEMI
jgi:micrococcal nuclease